MKITSTLRLFGSRKIIWAVQNYLCRAKLLGSCKIIWVVQNHLICKNLFGLRKLIWVVQNSELGNPSHNNNTLCPMSTQTSVQKLSQVSSPKIIKCDFSYSMLLPFVHCDLAFTEDSLQSVPKGRKSK